MFDPWPLRTKDNLLGEVILLSGSPYPEGLVSGFWPEDTLGNQNNNKNDLFSLGLFQFVPSIREDNI